MARPSLLLSILTLAATTGGCALTSDFDRFEQGGSGGSAGTGGNSGTGGDAGTGGDSGTGGTDGLDCDNPRNFCLRLANFDTRADMPVQVDLVADDFLRARAIFDPVEGDGDVEAILPLAILAADVTNETAFEAQVIIDADGEDGFVDSADPTLSAVVPPTGNVVIDNVDNADAVLDRPRELDGDFTMEFKSMTAHRGQLLEVWVQEEATGRTAGYYRLAEGPDGGEFTITIPGIIGDPGSTYRVQFYADFDDNGTYAPRAGNPAGDHSWVRTAAADDSGITMSFTHTGVFEDLDIPVGYGF